MKLASCQKLGDIASILSGFAFNSIYFGDKGDLPIVRIRDVVRGYSETFYSGEYSDTFVVNDGDLLIGMDGEFNAARWKGGKALLNQRVCKIEPDQNVLDKNYLFYFLPQELKKIEDATPFVTVKHLSVKALQAIEISLPSLDEQRRIASILDKVDAIRCKRQASIRLTEEFLRSVFLDMFGDPVTNPKRWPINVFGDIVDFMTSGSRGWAQHYSESGARFLRIQNVGRNKLLLNDIAYVSPPVNSEAKRTRVEAGDILLSITADLGRSAVIPEGFGEAYINQHLALLRVSKGEPLYYSAFIASDGGQRQIAALNKGGVKAGLNFNDIRSLQIPSPPDEAQKKWALIYRKQMKNIETMRRAYTTSENLFSSLAQRAFRGEL